MPHRHRRILQLRRAGANGSPPAAAAHLQRRIAQPRSDDRACRV